MIVKYLHVSLGNSLSNSIINHKLDDIVNFESIANINHSDSDVFSYYRLIILSGLHRGKFVSFQLLKELTNIGTAGNLSSHLHVLEKQGLIEYHKGESGRRTLAFYTLTEKGKNEVNNTIKNLQTMLEVLNQDK